MGDPDVREKRHKKFHNPFAKEVTDRKGPFKEKVVNPKKGTYVREKLNPRNILYDSDDVA